MIFNKFFVFFIGFYEDETRHPIPFQIRPLQGPSYFLIIDLNFFISQCYR